jgi:hypothetical protein
MGMFPFLPISNNQRHEVLPYGCRLSAPVRKRLDTRLKDVTSMGMFPFLPISNNQRREVLPYGCCLSAPIRKNFLPHSGDRILSAGMMTRDPRWKVK